MSAHKQYVMIGGDDPVITPERTSVRPPDEEIGAFVDWKAEYASRGFGELQEAPPEKVGALTKPRGLKKATAGLTGEPVWVFSQRTGYGRVEWYEWWRNVLEFLRKPEMLLRRLLIVAWVLLPPTAKQLRTRKGLYWEEQLSGFDNTVDLLGRKLRPVQVVPILRESIVRWIPKWTMRLLLRLRLIRLVGPPWPTSFGQETTMFVSSSGVISTAEHGVRSVDER